MITGIVLQTRAILAHPKAKDNTNNSSDKGNHRMHCTVQQTCSKILPPKVKPYNPPEVHRIWGIWGSYYNIRKAIVYLLKGNYNLLGTPSNSLFVGAYD